MTHTAPWSERLLGDGDAGPRHQLARLLVGIGLASLFGIALGLRAGGVGIAVHAVGVALGIAAVCGLAVPALAILLALADSTIDAAGLARATSRAAAHAGLLLAGLAPGAALFAVTVEDTLSLTLLGAAGLLLAGALGMRSFVADLRPHLGGGRLSRLAVPTFLVFAALLGARIWWISLPLVRGAA